MSVYVQFEHTIAGFNHHDMALYDTATKELLVTATRADDVWTIHADGVDDATVPSGPDRADAMTAMEAHAFAKLGPKNTAGHGYVTCRPRDLSQLP